MAFFLFFFSLFPAFPGVSGETQLQNDEECQSGIHCKRREQSLTVCPAGFFCPGGSSAPVPCPPGWFRSEGTALPSQSCLPCPAGFFNPRPGQKSCLPCGSEAEQPKEGQRSCVCLGTGRVFQPSDALCTCPPGFRSSGRDGRLCARLSYAACRDSASRNQDGQCLTVRGWRRYCSHKVCAVPSHFQGYDKVLGLCVCHSPSLEHVCDSQCRRQHRTSLQLSCAERKARLFIAHSNGSEIAVFLDDLRTLLPRPNFSLEDFCASGRGQVTHPAHVVEMSEKGFLGVYNPDPQLLHDFSTLNEASTLQQKSSPSATAPDQPGHKGCGEQNLNSPNSTSQSTFMGILNPIVCIGANVTLVFIVSREHFPVYDVNNLYNTNAEFDWGDFRSLREGLRETSEKFLLFLFQFQAPGTFVLRLSSNRHKRMYIRVMPAGAQCYEEGPFLPSTPRFAVQVGMARRRELLLKPDWAALAGLGTGLLLLLAACLALALLCQGLGWAPRGSPCPAFRRRQLGHNLDQYSSKIPSVFSIRKSHPSLQHGAATGCLLRRGEAWEPEEHVDLEAFNTKVFFELLLRQSHSVTSTLGHFKEEVKILYHRVMTEISSLKKLWIKTLSIPGKGEEDESTATGGCKKAEEQIYGLSGVSSDPWEIIPQKLIPLLRSVVWVLEENRKNSSSPETPGYSSRSAFKASAAHTEASKNEENRENPAPKASPALLAGTKELKEAEQPMAPRVTLLSTQHPAPPLHGDETKDRKFSFLLGLLQEVNEELRSHAVATGLGLKLEKTEMTAQSSQDASRSQERGLTAVDAAAFSPREFGVSQPLSELEDKVDALTEELLRITEDEQQFLSSKGNEDLLSYYLEITSLEKEALVKQINALEEEIAQGRKL